MADASSPEARADAAFMRRALRLARRGWGSTAPNPMVGAVVVRDGQVVGEGWHARYGERHAEVVALAAAGVGRVVAAVGDPSRTAAGGLARLQAAGIETTVGVLADEARELNASFFHAQRSGRPWVTLKLATSIDGAIADHTRGPGWLTGPAARREVHRLRAGSDAVGVGIGSALADDPALTVRDAPEPRTPPLRVVFDRGARLPLDGRLVRSATEVPVIAIVEDPPTDRAATLERAGVTVVSATDLGDGLRRLRADFGVRSLLVEGGAGLASALWGADLVDRLITFRAPVVLGRGAVAAFADAPAVRAGEARRLPVVSERRFGDDVMTIFAVHSLGDA